MDAFLQRTIEHGSTWFTSHRQSKMSVLECPSSEGQWRHQEQGGCVEGGHRKSHPLRRTSGGSVRGGTGPACGDTRGERFHTSVILLRQTVWILPLSLWPIWPDIGNWCVLCPWHALQALCYPFNQVFPSRLFLSLLPCLISLG